jgi:hypothetical protein
VLRLVAGGTVDEYDDTTAIKTEVARLAGVGREWVSIGVTPASVLITVTIAVPPSKTAEDIKESISSSLPDAATASAKLGISVEQTPTVVVAAARPVMPTSLPPVPPLPSTVPDLWPPPPVDPDQSLDNGGSGSMIGGVVAAGAAVVLLAAAGAAGYRWMKKRKKPPHGSAGSPNVANTGDVTLTFSGSTSSTALAPESSPAPAPVDSLAITAAAKSTGQCQSLTPSASAPTSSASAPRNAPGEWDFFLSHTQRDAEAKLLASELWAELGRLGYACWLDVKMGECDQDAMEEGAKNCKCLIAIVTDNGADSYFSRPMCRQEVEWAREADRRIVPVVRAEDKPRIGAFMSEGQGLGIDFSSYNFVHYDRSGPNRVKASLSDILVQSRSTGGRRASHSWMQKGPDPAATGKEGATEAAPKA